jgi:vancomycin permeability regulator SanA
MAKRFSILLVFILLNSVLFAGNLKAYFSYSTFYSPQTGPYIETYLSVIGNSLSYQKNENGMYQSNIDITIIFKKQGKIENYKKYNFRSAKVLTPFR